MKMCAKLPLDGKNFKYVICNDGVVICVKNLKFEQLLMRCEHLGNLFFPT